jgi:hypothetical protein
LIFAYYSGCAIEVAPYGLVIRMSHKEDYPLMSVLSKMATEPNVMVMAFFNCGRPIAKPSEVVSQIDCRLPNGNPNRSILFSCLKDDRLVVQGKPISK